MMDRHRISATKSPRGLPGQAPAPHQGFGRVKKTALLLHRLDWIPHSPAMSPSGRSARGGSAGLDPGALALAFHAGRQLS